MSGWVWAILVAGHGEAVAEADTSRRGHDVSHACWCWLLTEHTALLRSRRMCQCPAASVLWPWPGHWFTSESGAFIADSRRQTAATHREITFWHFVFKISIFRIQILQEDLRGYFKENKVRWTQEDLIVSIAQVRSVIQYFKLQGGL